MTFKNLHIFSFGKFYLFCFLLAVNSFCLRSQSIDRQVINSNGGSGNAGANFNVDFNVGEPIIVTGTNANGVYTQGFLQPDTVFSSAGTFSINIFFGTESCTNAADAFIYANPVNAVGPVTWSWFPTLDTTSTLTNIPAGTYILTASDTAGNSVNDTIVIPSSTTPCDLDIYNGLTPNNDGKNDVFYIGNIDKYPNNEFYVFNRYGVKVWEGKNYDNMNVVFAGKDFNGSDLPPATYFYILVIDGGQRKGWLELLR
jgi:gliding motility-associated-like protein